MRSINATCDCSVNYFQEKNNFYRSEHPLVERLQDPKQIVKFDTICQSDSDRFFLKWKNIVRYKFPFRLQRESVLLHRSSEMSEGCHPSPKAKNVEQCRLDSPSRQCSSPFSPQNLWVFGQTLDYCFCPLTACDFFLFPKLKKTLEGKRFDTIPRIEAK